MVCRWKDHSVATKSGKTKKVKVRKLKDAELPLRVNKTPRLGVIRAALPRDLLKDFQAFAKELEQEFASKLSQKCAGGTAGLQCGFAAKGYEKMEKGRGFLRESPSLVVQFDALCKRLAPHLKSHMPWVWQFAMEATSVAGPCRLPGLPATSCWYSRGSTRLHVDHDDRGLGFVLVLRSGPGGDLCCQLPNEQDKYGSVHLNAGDVVYGNYSTFHHFNLPCPTQTRRALVYYADCKIMSAKYKVRKDPKYKKDLVKQAAACRTRRLEQMKAVTRSKKDSRRSFKHRQ